ncbi:MAG: hypothetical protein GF309_07365 [Candidatus Lokiarchaeota archaeon]|nr:hypothetical protein [Candidatus Lokiarchaeota archaeon]
MKRWLMDILACPVKECRSSLDLEVLESHMVQTDDGEVEEIDAALITCPKCGRWYPVIDGIACMLPDNLRQEGKQKTEETAFLKEWEEKIPAEIIAEGIPFGLEREE